ncbi:hypothetical protein F4801DRAFT_450471 [Xylaria longipes]|nr:hypothetical protein F4801DRAFT_450471 [Xylaria longipes]
MVLLALIHLASPRTGRPMVSVICSSYRNPLVWERLRGKYKDCVQIPNNFMCLQHRLLHPMQHHTAPWSHAAIPYVHVW